MSESCACRPLQAPRPAVGPMGGMALFHGGGSVHPQDQVESLHLSLSRPRSLGGHKCPGRTLSGLLPRAPPRSLPQPGHRPWAGRGMSGYPQTLSGCPWDAKRVPQWAQGSHLAMATGTCSKTSLAV